MNVRKPSALVLLVLGLLGLPAGSVQAASPADPLEGYRNVAGLGLARELPTGGFELFRDRGTGRIVHGHDTIGMIPARSADAPSTAGSSATAPACVTSGNYYAHVIYAYPVDRASRYASMAEHIRDLVRDNTGRLVEEAGEFGHSRKYRVLCDASEQIVVSNVGVSVTSVTDFNALTLDLENKGYNAPGVKYWVWFDGRTSPGVLGTAYVYDDSSPSASNANNGNGRAMFAVLWGDEAGVPQYESTTWMHENAHNMGAVVSDAPNTSGNLHCTDDQDVMCYLDGGAQAACCFRSNVCTDREHFDCRHDDYFHPAPTSGFLTNHWNLGSTVNRFLDATAAVTVRFALSALTVNEDAGTVSLTVDRNGSATGTVGVTAATSPGTAQAGSDYTTTSQTLSFGPGVTQRSVSIPIVSDGATGENAESFTVGLSAPTGGATIGSPSSVTVTISESSGPPTLQFSAPTLSVNEGSSSASFTVTRSGATGSAVGATVSTSAGSATADADYTETTSTLSFAAGQTSTTFTVPLLDDQRFEPNETFTATLSAPTGGATLGSVASATATIVETDARPTLALTGTAGIVSEASGTFTATVTRTGALDDPVGVTFTTTLGTASSADLTPVTTTLAFPAGAVTRTVAIPIADDELIESTETFGIALSAPTGLAQLGTPSSASISILDDDGGIVEMTSSTITRSESTPVTFTATRTIPDPPASVDWQLRQIAPAGSSRSGTLTFAPGSSTASVTIDLNDTLPTGDRTFTFTLSNPVQLSIGPRNGTTLTLTDDETPPSIGFVADTLRVPEDIGTATVTVARTGNTNAAASVTLAATGGSASLFTDLTVPTGTVAFAPGEVIRTVSVSVANDTLAERDESASLTLSSPSGGRLDRSSLSLTIAASDQQPDVLVYGTNPSPTGNNQYASTPSTQSAPAASPRATGPNAASFAVENDGNARNTITITASVPTDATELRYRIDGVDVTTAITSAAGYDVTLDALTRIVVRVEHRPTLTALPGTQRPVVLRARWTGDGVREDAGTLTYVVL